MSDEIHPARLAYDRAVRNGMGSAIRFVLEHWLALAVVVNTVTITVAVVDPLLASWGIDWLALPIWNFYHNFCVQEHLYYLWGHPVALCQRNLAVFSSLLGGMLLFSGTRRWLPSLPFWGYVALAAPMALDGFTQLFGWRVSTLELRTFTGVLFGLGSIWYLFPSIQLWTQRLLFTLDHERDDEADLVSGHWRVAAVRHDDA
jgi:uncharacterized membrane protein